LPWVGGAGRANAATAWGRLAPADAINAAIENDEAEMVLFGEPQAAGSRHCSAGGLRDVVVERLR
jgi:hypothetical protein